MPEWKTTTLGEFVSLQRGHDLPQRERRPGRIPVVGSGGVTGFHDTAVVSGPGITIGRAANLGVPTLIQGSFWPLNTTLYVTDFHGNNVRFTYYLLRTLDLTGFNSGSVQPMLNRNYIRNFSIRVPDTPGQEAIASVLGALDDKIAVSDQIALVSSDLISAIFQQSLESPGSMTVRLVDVVGFDFGLPFASDSFNAQQQGLPLLRIRDIKEFSPQVWTTERIAKDVIVEPGDVVAGMDAEFRPAFWLGAPALLNQRVMRGRPIVKGGGLSFVREILRKPLSEIEAHKTGTTVIHLNKRDLDLSSVKVPSQDALEAFEVTAEPLRRRIVAAAGELRSLTQLRDALLPKLMSGEIRVRDAEKVVEDVT